MSDADEAPSALTEAGVTFDAESGELSGPAGVARLAPQPAALLRLLVEEAGAVVTRSRIREHLWPGGRVEFDQGIAFAMREIRKALEAVGADPGLVETLPRRGFRLGAPAGWPADAGGADRRRWVPWVVVAAGTVLALTGLAVLRWDATPADSVPVVLIFPHDVAEGAVDGPASRALAEELTARLTTELAGRAGIVGPDGTAGVAGPDDTEGARAALGACLVVSGSVQPLGADSVVVFTQLVRTEDRVHVWAHRDTLPLASAWVEVGASILDPVRAALRECSPPS